MLKISMKTKRSGFSLIELLIVVTVIGVIGAIAIPNLISVRRSANEASATASIRIIITAEYTYRDTVGNGNFGLMPDLVSQNTVDSLIGSGSKSGYLFTVTKNDAGGSGLSTFDVTGIPIIFGSIVTGTGARSYYTNESGSIFYNSTSTPPSAVSNTDRTIANGAPI